MTPLNPDTRITLATTQARLVAGATYLVVADFSASGRFADEDCRTALRLDEILAVAARNENLCGPDRQSWTVWTAPYQTYALSGAPAGGPYPNGHDKGDACADGDEYSGGPYPYGHGLGVPSGGPYPYGHDMGGDHGGLIRTLEMRASVKNEGWTGTATDDVPTRWTVQRIA